MFLTKTKIASLAARLIFLRRRCLRWPTLRSAARMILNKVEEHTCVLIEHN